MKSTNLGIILCSILGFTASCTGEVGPNGTASVGNPVAAPEPGVSVPNLRPMTATRAAEMASYARKLKLVDDNLATAPIPWSDLFSSCSDRAYAVQWALLETPMPGQPNAPFLRSRTLSNEYVDQVTSSPWNDAATIVLTGPLVTYEQFRHTNGQALPGPTQRFFWFDHYATVVNVDGQLRVMDLTSSDALYPISSWVANFVDSSTPCAQVGEDEYRTIESYWLAVHNGLPLLPTPERLCGYKIVPALSTTENDDLSVRVQNARGTISGLFDTSTWLKNTLAAEYQTVITDAEVPYISGQLSPGSLENVCGGDWRPGMLACRPTQEIESGVSKAGSVAVGEEKFYHVNLHSGPGSLTVTLTGASGANLYVSRANWPTVDVHECEATGSDNTKTCSLNFNLGLPPGFARILVRGNTGATNYQVTATVQ